MMPPRSASADLFRVRESLQTVMLSHHGADLLQVVRSHPLASVAVSGGHHSVGYSPYSHQDLWMQTTGTLLLAVQRCSSIRLRTAAHGEPELTLDEIARGRGARGLLYLAAVPISGARPRALSRSA
jgi:hypothetical protein